MHQHNRLRAAFLVSSMAVALAAQGSAQTPAPQDYQPGQVIKVAFHYSRWNYPKEITLPEGCQLHVVETGDTLWDLGQKYLGNPFSWPQIWEMNQWITDPHWIYPGDHLVIPAGRKAIQPGQTPSEISGLAPGGRLQTKLRPDEYAFTFQDFLQLPYLVPNGAEAHFKEIGAVKVASRKDPLSSQLGDLDTIYLDGGSDNGLKIGDRLLALKVVKAKLPYLGNDKRFKNMGDVIKQFAVVRVTQLDAKSAVAVIEKSADSLEVGDRVVPFKEPANLVMHLREDARTPVLLQDPIARIVYAADSHMNAGTNDMVLIDRGSKDGLQVGQVLLSARERTWPVGAPDAKPQETAKTNYLIAQLLVVKTMEDSATCRILRAYEEVMQGDLVTR